jgi:hypothetical protein
MRRRILAAALAVVVGGGLLAAAPAGAAVQAIEGTVTRPGGAPFPGLTVYVPSTTYQTTTDADGRYRLELSPGTYRIAAGDFLHPETATYPDEIVLAAGATVTGIDMTATIARTGRIEGQVLAAGQPVPGGATVHLYVASNRNQFPPVRTDGQSRFAFPGLPDDTYEVYVDGATGYAAQWWDHATGSDTAGRITIAGGNTASVTVNLEPPTPPGPSPIIVDLSGTRAVKRDGRSVLVLHGLGLGPVATAKLSGNGVKRLKVTATPDARKWFVVVTMSDAPATTRTLTVTRSDGEKATISVTVR